MSFTEDYDSESLRQNSLRRSMLVEKFILEQVDSQKTVDTCDCNKGQICHMPLHFGFSPMQDDQMNRKENQVKQDPTHAA